MAALLMAALAPSTAALASPAPSANPVGGSVGLPAAIVRADFLTQAQIRARLDLSRPLTSYDLSPTDRTPEPDPDCATNRPEVVSSKSYPAQQSRTQVFEYRVPGATWAIQGSVMVFEYSTRAKAKTAYKRVVAAVRSSTGYTLVSRRSTRSSAGRPQLRPSPCRAPPSPGSTTSVRLGRDRGVTSSRPAGRGSSGGARQGVPGSWIGTPGPLRRPSRSTHRPPTPNPSRQGLAKGL